MITNERRISLVNALNVELNDIDIGSLVMHVWDDKSRGIIIETLKLDCDDNHDWCECKVMWAIDVDVARSIGQIIYSGTLEASDR
jgi:hypothetical protein